MVIDAPRQAIEAVIGKHAVVQQLLDNGWLHLWRFDKPGLSRYASGDWPLPLPQPVEAAAGLSPMSSIKHRRARRPWPGLKVIELGQLIAGPFAASTVDFGADVIKIEPPGLGDPLRKWRLLKDGTSIWWQVQSRNKRSLALDLRAPKVRTWCAGSPPRPTC